jgi:NADH:ubiquinone oxidoreductase subunit E
VAIAAGSRTIRLLICVGPRCDAEGRGRALLDKAQASLNERFAEAFAEGRLAIATRDCLRLCTRDPVVRLEPSGEAFSNPDLEDLLRDVICALEATQK